MAAARPRRPRPVAGRHRHQRQDHDGADAPVHPHRRRAPRRRGGQRGPADRRGRDGPRALRRPRRRALQLPAPLHPLDGRGVGRRAQHRRGPPRLVRRRAGRGHRPGRADGHGGLRRRQGARLRRCAAGVRLQPRRRCHRGHGPRGRRRRGRACRGLHPRHAVRRQPRCRGGPPRRPGVHRGARDQRRRALHAGRPRLARPALRRQRPGRRRARASPRRQPAGGARRAARVPPRRPPDRPRRGGRRRDLDRRLQGHQPARRPVVPLRLRGRRVDRGRPRQGRPVRRPGGRGGRPAAWCRPARPGPPGGGRRTFATRARCAGHRCGRGRDWGSDGARGRRGCRARQVR